MGFDRAKASSNAVLTNSGGMVAIPPIALPVGQSPAMYEVESLVARASQHTYPVLILGETGTGKELVAHSIHDRGPRGQMPFAPVDCAALTASLIESELFGHVKGAFTDATRSTSGLFEAANGGTLFLDEIGNLPMELQSKLLRAIQEKEIRPVGSTERISVNIRVIAATNRDLDAAVRDHHFRQDLYYRLNVVEIKLPPLRERKADIPLLVTHFLNKFCRCAVPRPVISSTSMKQLYAYNWPGNVRELENVIERAAALGSGLVLDIEDLASNIQAASSQDILDSDQIMPLEEVERRAISRALRETGGDKIRAALLLGIGKTTLYRKLLQYSRAKDLVEKDGESGLVHHPRRIKS